MPSIFVIVIVICSGLALSICMREMLLQGLDSLFSQRAESQIRKQMKTVDFQLTGRISDEWLERLIATIAESEAAESEAAENDAAESESVNRIAAQSETAQHAAARHGAAPNGTGLQRFDYMVWMIGLAIISFGGLVAGFAQLAAQ